LAGTALSRQFSSKLLENNKISTEKEFAIQSHPDRKFIRLIRTPKKHISVRWLNTQLIFKKILQKVTVNISLWKNLSTNF